MAFDTNVYDFQFNSAISPNTNLDQFSDFTQFHSSESRSRGIVDNSSESMSSIDDFGMNPSQKPENYIICSMCHSKIKDCGIYSLKHDLIFCDLICAKIYSDNVNKIDIDFQTYRNNYISKKLSGSAEKIYQKYKYKFFQQLPILIIKDNDKNVLNQYLIEDRLREYKSQFRKIKSAF